MPGVKKLISRVIGDRSGNRRRMPRNHPKEAHDVEEALRPRAVRHRSASHMMANDDVDDYDDEEQYEELMAPQSKAREISPQEEKEAWNELMCKLEEKAESKGMSSITLQALVEDSWELIQENWLGEIDTFPGNQYTIAAFGLYNLTTKETLCTGEECCSSKKQKEIARVFGGILVWLIQVVGPPAIFLSTVFTMGVPVGHGEIKWAKWQIDLQDWHTLAFTKALSIASIFCFILNGIFTILDEKHTWRQIDHVFTYMQIKTDNFQVKIRGEGFMYLGAFTNCWVVLWCCLDTLVVLGAAMSPKDVIFDSLGLIFLFNLDDIDGDLGFIVDDDWPGDRLGWIYRRIAWEEGDDEREFDCMSTITYHLYNLTVVLLYIMLTALPVFCFLTSFSTICPAED